MTLVLGPLLANGEVADLNESMDKENTTENKRYTPIITREKKRRLSRSNDTTSTQGSKDSNDDRVDEKENQNGQKEHTEHNNNKKPLHHSTNDLQEKPNAGKSLRTSKGGSVCVLLHFHIY
jgi:hypothetical protein